MAKKDIDCYWVWETKNDRNLAERLEERVKFKKDQEFVDDLNSLKGQIMSLKNRKDLKEVIIKRIEGFINSFK